MKPTFPPTPGVHKEREVRGGLSHLRVARWGFRVALLAAIAYGPLLVLLYLLLTENV